MIIKLHIADIIALRGGIGVSIDSGLYKIEEQAMKFFNFREKGFDAIMGEMIESVDKIIEEISSR